MRTLLATPQFEKDLAKIPTYVKEHSDQVISGLLNNPLNPRFDTRKLKNIQPSVYRIRIGSYRLVYSFTKTSLTLHRIRHRKDIYR